MLKATIENLAIRGSRAMLRKIESSALVSSGCSVAEPESCGAKFTTTFTLSGPSCCARSTGGSCLNGWRSEEHTSELQSRPHLVCRLLLEKKKQKTKHDTAKQSYMLRSYQHHQH